MACAHTYSCECQCVAMFFLVIVFGASLTIRLRNRTKPVTVPERPVEHPASHRSILPRKGAQPRVTVGVGSDRGKYLWTEGYRTHRTPAVANWRVYTNDGTHMYPAWIDLRDHPGTSMYSFGLVIMISSWKFLGGESRMVTVCRKLAPGWPDIGPTYPLTGVLFQPQTAKKKPNIPQVGPK